MNDETSKKDSIEPKATPPAAGTKKKIPDAAIRTLEKGSAEAIKGKQGIFVKIAIAEEKRREEERVRLEKMARQRVLYGAIGTLFVLLAAAAILFVLRPEKFSLGRTATQTPALKFGTVYAEIQTAGLSKRELVRNINEEASAPIPQGIVKTIYLTERTGAGARRITIEKFFQLLEMDPPASLTKETLSGEFLLNAYGGTEKNTIFILAKALSGTNALKDMALWEPSIANDMADLFSITATIEANRAIFGTPLEDRFVENILARTLENESGSTLFLYALLNDQTLVFTTDPEVLSAIIQWLYAPVIRN